MQGKIIDFSKGMNGKQRITLELDGDIRELYEELKEFVVDIVIKKFRKGRSLDANAYAWVLMEKLAVANNIPKTDIYRNTIRKISGVSETVCVQDAALERLCSGWEHNGKGWQAEKFPSKIEGCTNVTLYYGSSTYDSAQMSRLISQIVEDCQERGIETMTPAELARLMEGWK